MKKLFLRQSDVIPGERCVGGRIALLLESKEAESLEIVIACDNDDLVSLTDLHQASGASPNKQPSFWVRNASATEFIDALAAKLNLQKSRLWKSSRGKRVGGNPGVMKVCID